jgi:GR25 family glycosyltransferase involved in LPS biosynthesis
MRVGITAHFQFSVFSGGGASSVFAIAEMMKVMGHEVTLLNLNGTQDWWDDLQSLKDLYPRKNVCDIKGEDVFDLVLEVSGTLADKETRQRCGKHCIWVIRKPILLGDIETSIFPISMGRRCLDGLTAVWAMDQETTQDDIQYLETLSRVPVLRVPFVWSPSLVMTHKKDANFPLWIQVAVTLTQQAQKVLPWSVHVCETNNSATSSCTLPLVTLRELKRQNQFYFEKYRIHNAQPVENSEFFKQNVWAHSQIQGLSGEFVGRQRIVDWSVDPMSCILAHIRFRRLRPYLLEALWLGIPLVHNAPALKNLIPEYNAYTYTDNNLLEAVKAMNQIQKDIQEGKGMFQQTALPALQQKILELFSPISVNVIHGWKHALATLSSATVTPVSSPVPLLPPVKLTPPVNPVPVNPVTVNPVTVTPVTSTATFTVLFMDMWDGFHPDYNFFTLLLQEGSKQLQPRPIIQGVSKDTLPAGTKPNMILFGPFGSEWKEERWKGIPKAHFTGENTNPIQAPDVFLNMGYPHADFVDEKYIRLPLWMLEIDWFGADVERIQNPKPLPLDRCLNVYPDEIANKKRFCAFVVTNPCNPVRNSAFHWLSQYKKVDSAGRLFNNIGDEIFAGLGGGGGELKKHEFLKQYKFCFAYENSSSQGYTTEKLLHAKIAGCIPIYWGDPKVERDFDTKGFLDARKFTRPEELIEAVRKIDEDPELYKKMVSIPALDDYKRDLVRRIFSQVAYKMLKTAYSDSIQQDQIPKFLGGKTSSEAKELGIQRDGLSKPVTKEVKKDPILLTMASQRFLPSLFTQLSGIAQQKKVMNKLDCIVWLAKDIPSDVEAKLKEQFSFVRFERLPEDTVIEGFPDYWEPQHFAWKLWLFHWISQQSEYTGRLLLYMDAGVFLSRWPVKWLSQVEQEGICLLEDPRQTNGQWCHETFCKKLHVTEEEKSSQQLWAGCLAFQVGHPLATKLIQDAYELSKIRDVIVGPKWEGLRSSDGKPYGHRHDQSILSILSQRMKVPRYPMDDIYCDHSLRKTFQTEKALYVHRGTFTLSKPFAKEISDAFVINLDRRADRMEKLYKNSPELEGRVQRFSAYEGRALQLTPAIARLFRPHDFLWKKAIMGCALSHLELWWQLVHERPDIQNYLILEDDVKLQKGWEEKWNAATPYIPEEYDVIYLGGILPPNRQGFEAIKEKVNPYFSKVALNQVFGQTPPNRYFHWCNYSYILSRKGAEKIIQLLMERDGYYTSADHMVCNRVDKLNHYFLDPLVSGCYQDEDPKYQTSAFNNFNRVDGFDSDLWNNDERFTPAEYEPLLKETEKEQINIEQALADGRKKEKEKVNNTVLNPREAYPKPPHRVFVTLEQHKFNAEKTYERQWLEELLGKNTPFRVITLEDGVEMPDKPIVIVQKPYVEHYTKLFEQWEAEKFPYYVLHLSDEFGTDPVSFYSFSQCLGIVRMYPRASIPMEKTVVIPLGYHWTTQEASEDPLNKTPRLPFRNTLWSFYGTNWQNRKQDLNELSSLQPNSLLLVDSWESPEKLTHNQYIARMLDTVFVPCPQGNNVETFRLYEALECGCIPIYVKNKGDDLYRSMLQEELGILPVSSWQEAKLLMEHLWKEKVLLETYRNTLLTQWKVWKAKLSGKLQKIWDL